MKFLKIDIDFENSNFCEIESFYLYRCPSSVANFYHQVSKEMMLEYLKGGFYELALESYVKVQDDEFNEFNRQINLASKMQRLKTLAKNAK